MAEDRLRASGTVRFIWDEGLPTERVEEEHNLVMLAPRTVLLNALLGVTTNISDVLIKGVAVGTGTATTVIDTETTLTTEVARKAITSSVVNDDTAVFRAYFSVTEANVVIKEVALFGGSTWNVAVPNSGKMFSKIVNLSKDKTGGGKSLTLEWAIKLSGS